ncbi:MAG: ABC transporter substrate-binding protein, partial [Verrucomicrobiota bacterium]|nr:ABC transporter substrate-binding protein [Verrucomicrobiota bacterium]
VDPLAKPGQKSEPIPWESVVASDPEVLLLSPCGCTMEEICEAGHGLRKLRGWSHLRAVREKRVYAVEPNLYTQPSASSLVEGMELLAHLLHPEVFPHDANGPTRFIRFAS